MSDRCIDLKCHFGDHYRVEYEESYIADRGSRARTEDPWLMIILCQHGHIYSHGDNLLGVSTNRQGPITEKTRNLPCTTVVQDSDEGINATFHLNDFDQVAKIVKPRRRRRLSPEQRQKLMESSIKTQFKSGAQSPPGEQGRDPKSRTHRKTA